MNPSSGTHTMHTWIIKPHDTIMFRDARPFEAGASARSMPMPWPSTLAGMIRSRFGRDRTGTFTLNTKTARAIAVRGPWVVELNEQGEVCQHYFPAPADAVMFKNKNVLTLRRLSPKELDSDVLSDLPEGLRPVGFDTDPGENPGKPTQGAALWSLEKYMAWMGTPESIQNIESIDKIGISSFNQIARVHVQIDPKTGTALEGHLFQTSMLETTRYKANEGYREFAFAMMVDDDKGQRVDDDGPDVMGGERRIVHVRESKKLEWKAPEVKGQIVRVVLLTPGIFEEGYKPSKIDGARVIAASVKRPQAISGWDLEKSQPKATRQMAPAGSVYWLEVEGDAQQWVNTHHLSSICDNEQDRRDGFGLIAVGQGGIR